jgi:hypothetical protein
MRSAVFLFALLVFIPCAGGQTASLAINSAALNIDPTSTDSYTLQGAFASLDFTSAQSVIMQVGPFSSTLPIAAFTSPSSGVLNYQDSTGQSPYWISSLTIDTNASTFTGQATGVVLSGIENPSMFPYRLFDSASPPPSRHTLFRKIGRRTGSRKGSISLGRASV